MIFKARDDFQLDLERSYFIGDTLTDILAGKNAGCQAALVNTGDDPDDQKRAQAQADFSGNNLKIVAE